MRSARILRLAVLAVSLALSAPAVASAAPGTLEASVIDCSTSNGEVVATVGVSISGATPDTPIWLRVSTALSTVPPSPFPVGSTDGSGSLTYEVAPLTERYFPVGVSAFVSDADKLDPAAQIGTTVGVGFVCPILGPQDALDKAVTGGALSERDAAPLAVKLGAAADQAAKGNTGAAINLLRAAKQQVDALVAAGRLSAADAQLLLSSIDREIVRLGGTP